MLTRTETFILLMKTGPLNNNQHDNLERFLLEQDAELTRLRAALDAMTAERDAARAKVLDSLAAEYFLTPPLYNGDMQSGRRDAVRGIAVRLGVYADLDDSLETAAMSAMIEQEDKG